jgi:hypothetical protein
VIQYVIQNYKNYLSTKEIHAKDFPFIIQNYFSERRIQMKKTQDPTERFAFHLITSRDIALNIATDGLTCEQLSFSIEKYLGKLSYLLN